MNTDNGNNMTEYTTCKELGWKVGDKFKVVKKGVFDLGEVVTLDKDDGTTLPYYTRSGHKGVWCEFSGFLEPYVEAKELTGDSVDYYKLHVSNPTTYKDEYDCECNDIIEALNMTYAEGNIFKAVWRTAAARKGNGKVGHTSLYDAEKIVFFGNRLIAQAKGE